MSNSQFEQFNLQPQLQAALSGKGFNVPTPIQAKVIPQLLSEERQDLVALAQTGSGKTLAFGVPLAEKLNPSKDRVQALVLTPTRELAAQVSENLNQIFPSLDLRSLAIYGGTSYSHQRSKLKRTPHVVIATPGRLVDLIHQKQIELTDLKVLVLDEADRMLSMGFEEDLQFILDATHKSAAEGSGRASCQTWLFSATMGPGIKRILHKYLNEPVMINQVEANQGVSATLEHLYLAVRGGQRQQGLLRILSSIDDFYGIVFCQTKKEVQEVEDALRAHRVDCMSIHGDKVQKEREQIIQKLKQGRFSVLVATDVAARGIDVKNLKHVVHYSLPYELESYIHRSGRTGRAGETGVVISILESSDFGKLNRLVRTTQIEMKPFKPMTGEELMQKFVTKELSDLEMKARHHPLYHKILFTVERFLEAKDSTLTTSEWIAHFLVHKMSRTDLFSDAFIMTDFSMAAKPRNFGQRNEHARFQSRGNDRSRQERRPGPSRSSSAARRASEEKSSTGGGVTRFKDRRRKSN
jgi:ATP-dependent RNA helicase DeaD